MKVVFLFVDGLGIGRQDKETNPCCFDETGIFQIFQNSRPNFLPFDGISLELDATMGISGLPQSATGQTALLTGINSAQLLGRHLSGFPNKTLREALLKQSLLLKLKKKRKKPAFLNAFRPLFFELEENEILRLSATTIANHAANLPFFTLEDIIQKRAIYQDFTNYDLIEKGFEMPVYTPEEAAEIVAEATNRYDFILYEYFKSDKAGHNQDMPLAIAEIQKLGRFVFDFLNRIDLTETIVILTSDHGNIEDLSTKSHTRNPAMTITWGANKNQIAGKLKSITDLTPAIVFLMDSN
ncbi:alkaline phosphatase family protein [candidate division KSB1 bacterium]|nr:alkaline phosphatase family protein [candidate division KSB1 bacterium]